jgi:hypothetical protein
MERGNTETNWPGPVPKSIISCCLVRRRRGHEELPKRKRKWCSRGRRRGGFYRSSDQRPL